MMSVRKNVLYLILLVMVLIMTISLASCQTSSPLDIPVTSSTSASTPAISQQVKTPREYYELGVKLREQQQLDSALMAFQEVIKLDPNYKEAYYEQSKMMAQKGDWDKAISNCRQAISINPHYSQAYYIRGLSQMMNKQYELAITDLKIAAEMEINKKELEELRKITNLVIPSGELILLHMQLFSTDGRDCRGNYQPYTNTLQLQLFVNSGDSGVEVDKMYLDPGIGGKSEVNSPIRYYGGLGLQYLVVNISSANPPISAPTCTIDYRSKGSSTYFKKSNEISNDKITVIPSELICPTN